MDLTHEVFDQPGPLVNHKLFEGNQPLRDAMKFNAPWLDADGQFSRGFPLGTAWMRVPARLANVNLWV